jgi:hypothetical protein
MATCHKLIRVGAGGMLEACAEGLAMIKATPRAMSIEPVVSDCGPKDAKSERKQALDQREGHIPTIGTLYEPPHPCIHRHHPSPTNERAFALPRSTT